MLTGPVALLLSGAGAIYVGWPAFATCMWGSGVLACLYELVRGEKPDPPRERGEDW